MAEEKDKDFENQDPDLENINTGNKDIPDSAAEEAAAENHPAEEVKAENHPAEEVAAEEEEIRVSVDEEWAETLHIKFDHSRLRQTPPPIPGVPVEQQIPEIPVQPSPLMDLPHADHLQQEIQPAARPTQGFAPQQPRQELPPMPQTYLVAAIVITILCCTLPGIVALYFSSKVTSRYYMGDYAGAERASRNAERWLIASVVLGVVSAAIYIPLIVM